MRILCVSSQTHAYNDLPEDKMMMDLGELVINASSDTGPVGGTTCVDFSVENFINVQTLQFSVHFDPTVLDPICPPTQFSLLGLQGNNFNCNNVDEGFLRMVWVDPNSGLNCGETVDDGTVIFTLCFDVIGQPGRTSPVYVADDQLDIEYSQIIDCDDIDNFVTFSDITSNAGEVTIECGSLSVFADVCDSAPAQNNGSATFYGCGGTGPYNYNFNGGQVTGTSDELEEIVVDNLAPGAYTIVITDAGGGMETLDFTVGQNNPITVTYDITQPSCYTQDNGRIEIASIDGGTPNYTTQWDNFQFNNPEYRGLRNGTYGLTVTDDLGCKFTDMIEVRVDTLRVFGEILEQPSCPGAMDGRVRITATGGTPYPGNEYLLNRSGPAQEFIDINVSDGLFPISAEDDARTTCQARDTLLLEPLGNISVEIEPQDVLCFGTNTGSVLATASGSTNFAFSLVDEDGKVPVFFLSGKITKVCVTPAQCVPNRTPTTKMDKYCVVIQPDESEGSTNVTYVFDILKSILSDTVGAVWKIARAAGIASSKKAVEDGSEEIPIEWPSWVDPNFYMNRKGAELIAEMAGMQISDFLAVFTPQDPDHVNLLYPAGFQPNPLIQLLDQDFQFFKRL